MTIVYLLVEESFRELASRQVIAADCLALGLDVLIAQQWWFNDNLSDLPAGIVLFKGNNRPQGALMSGAKRHGHVVTSLEEEAFGTIYEPEIRTLYDPVSIDVADRFFVQGAIHRDFLAKWFPETRGRISVVGNPRSDVLLHALGDTVHQKAARLRAEYGDFILVNTNCASINPFDIDTYSYYQRCVDVGVLNPEDPGDLDRFDTLMEWEHSNLREMSRFIRHHSERMADVPIILRPHPSENHRTWEKSVSGLSNVHLVRDRDHIAWILASRAMVHTGCTTGLESSLLGTPTIGICPDQHPWHAGFISNVASQIRETGDAAATLAAEILINPRHPKEGVNEEIFEQLRSSLDIQRETRSSQRIATVLASMPPPISSGGANPRFSGGLGSGLGGALSGRRQDKAFVDFGEFQASWRATMDVLGLADHAKITEIAPTVFHLAASTP
jgi:surface carbohydrate biosynthesis protein